MSAQPMNPNVPEDHITIEINGQSLTTPKDAMIIQAADAAGIPIPRFCYHEKLSLAASCRMCLVEVEKMGKTVPACATPVSDGMKVHTNSEKALKSQRGVMEFLLINHPLDCPVCDQGGECELQDVAMGYGRSVGRMVEAKRVVPDEDLGSLVATEMTRCIHCTRCVRFTAEIAGTYELGGMYRGDSLQIGTYDGKPLTTELSGNVIDVCPVGALTNKVFQFRARPWELTASPSLGYHDALGSNLHLHTQSRSGQILRTVPRDNEAVNECWLSDRDRYSHQGLHSQDRATTPLQKIDGQWQEVTWDAAIGIAAEILQQNQGDNLGVLVHPATSNEEGALLARLAAGLNTGNLDHRIANRDFSDGAVAQSFAMPVAEIENADAIVIFGSNIRHELPLLHHRIRKANVQHNAQVHSINPVDFDFAFNLASKQIVAPSKLAETLLNTTTVAAVKSAKNAVLLVGAIVENHPQAAQLRAAAQEFATLTGAKLCRIPQGANAIGLTQAGVLPTDKSVADMLASPRQAYVLYGIEPGLDFADTASARKALTGAKVVAFSQFACASTRDVADIILPIAALPEMAASLTNLEGRKQQTKAAGRLPGQAREGWKVLRVLGNALQLTDFEFTDIASAHIAAKTVEPTKSKANTAIEGDGLELVVSPAIYRGDAVVRRATALQDHPLNQGACIVLNPQDADELKLTHGAMVKASASAGTAGLPLVLDKRVAPGAAWIESGYGATTPLGAGRVTVVNA